MARTSHAVHARQRYKRAELFERGSSSSLVFAGLLIAGLVVRILAINSTWGQPDGDEATGMLMALRASQGHFSLLFWGGNYGGAVVTWIEAPLVAVFGLKIWLFEAMDTALTLVAVLLLRGIGRRFLSPLAADVAAGTFWFFPALWVFWSAREYVFWLPAIVLALATCLFILKWFETPRRGHLWAVGLCAGLAIWSYPLVFPLIGPALVIFAWTLRKDLRALVDVGVTGLIGVAPWLAYFAVHGRAAFALQSAPGSRITDLGHTLSQVLPTALVGGQIRSDVIWATPDASAGHLAWLGVGVYLAVFVYTLVVAFRREVALAACGVSVLVWPFVLVIGHVPVGDATFRYGLIPIAPLLLLAAHLLSRVRLAPLLAIGALASVTYTISADTSGFAAAPTCNQSLAVTSRYLASQHRTTVWASYWLSGPLEVCSDNGVVASSVAPIRDQLAASEAAAAAHSTYVVFAGNVLDQEIGAWTTAHHVPATRTTVGGYAVWAFTTQVTPTQMQLNSAF
jgi:hypothetical protein